MKDRRGSAEIERLNPNSITRLTFGVRYEPQYGLMDRVGVVIDAVLRDSGSPFGPETFPLSQANSNEHVLLNLETNSSLRINQQDTILQVAAVTRKTQDVVNAAQLFGRYVLQPLRKLAGLRHIVRFGQVVHLEAPKGSLHSPPIERYLAQDFPGARALSMRFTKRLAAEEAMVKKRVDDYRNVIYTIEETEEREVSFALDYQEYFKPPLDAGEWDERPFGKFAQRGVNYFEGEFQSWLNKMVGRTEVA